MKKYFTSPIVLLLMVAVFAVITMMFLGEADAAEEKNKVTLAWDANSETDLAGYRLYYRTSGASEAGDEADQGASPIEIPLASLANAAAPQYAITGLAAANYVFVVTAYNTFGMESGYSNAVQARFEQIGSPPAVPAGARATIDISVTVR